MDEEGFIDYIWEELFYGDYFDNPKESVCYDLAKQFYEDFCSSNDTNFYHNIYVWCPYLFNQDLAAIIVKEELAAMEYE